MKETTPATIYLDTAQYLIVSEEKLLEELRPYLKDRIRVCMFTGNPPMDKVSKFLAAHTEDTNLRDWKYGTVLPMLDCTKERLKFIIK